MNFWDGPRLWEPTGMTTARWREIPPTRVPILKLTFCQRTVDVEGVVGLTHYSDDEYPHVVFWRGMALVTDGHHRLVRALVRGERDALVRIIDR